MIYRQNGNRYIPKHGRCVSVYGRSDFIKNILICVPKVNEGLTGLERHEGE